MAGSPIAQRIRLAAIMAAMAIPSLAIGQENPPPVLPKETPRPAASDDGFPLPPGAIHRFGNRQLRHPDGIVASAISPDGKYLATGSPSAVVVWDLQTLKARQFLSGARLKAYRIGDLGNLNRLLVFTADSAALVVLVGPTEYGDGGRRPGTVTAAQVWDVATGKVKFEISAPWDYYNACWITADGKEIALFANNNERGTIHYFDSREGKPLRTIKLPRQMGPIYCAAAGQVLAYPTEQGRGPSIIDPKVPSEIFTVTESFVPHAAFSRDGKLFAFSDVEGKVRVHDVSAKKELFAFDHPEPKKPGPMIVSPDGKTLYFSSDHGRLFRWDLKANEKLPDFANRHNFWSLTSFALSPDGMTLYSMSADQLIKRWDTKTGKELPLPEGYTTQTTMVTAIDGKHLIVSDHEGQIDFWDLKTGRRTRQLQPSHLGGINCLAQSADGRLLAAGRTSQDVRIFDLSTSKVVRDIPLGDNSDAKWGDPVHRVAFGSDGKVLLTGSTQTGVTAWEMATGKKLWRNPGAGLFAADPSGRWLAIVDNNQQAVSWIILDPATGDVRFRIEVVEIEIAGKITNPLGFPVYVTDLTATPDGSRLITTHYDGTVRIWSPDKGKELAVFQNFAQGPAKIAVSLDGKWLGVAASDYTVTVWDLAAAKQVHSFVGNNSASNQLAFTRDGRGLITSADLAPLLWDLAPNDLPAVDGPADALWNTLTGDDAAKAYRMQWALSRAPTVAVRVLAERIKLADWESDRPVFDKTVANLDSPRFAVREAAEKALAAAGERLPGNWLRNALADTKSEEVRTRLDRVLAGRSKQPDLAARRVSRAVQVLELIGTAEATALLKTWAKATGGSVLADEAMAALGRLGR